MLRHKWLFAFVLVIFLACSGVAAVEVSRFAAAESGEEGMDNVKVLTEPAANKALNGATAAPGDTKSANEMALVTVAASDNKAEADGVETKGEETTLPGKKTKIATIAIDKEGFPEAFIASLSMILVSELGDKTFFIAAIMAMTNDKTVVYGGAMGALAVMTILSAALGYTVPNIIPRQYTQNAATLLFIFFGFKLLKEAYETDPNAENEELHEVEEELAQEQSEKEGMLDLEEGGTKGKKSKSVPMMTVLQKFFSKVFLQSFTMTFLAEWGDRSQIATIALAAAKDPVGVTVGGILGHALCTGLAVLGGKMAATRISERMVKFIGGILFLVFAVHSIVFGFT